LPRYPDAPSLKILSENTSVEIDSCITGSIRSVESARVTIKDSIVDATSKHAIAYAALNGDDGEDTLFGGRLTVENSTIIGRVYTDMLEQAANSIFLARSEAEPPEPIAVARRQSGGIRFSYLPLTARVPRRYQCQPPTEVEAIHVRPSFTSLHYGEPGYCQLDARCSREIRHGAENEAEMGAFNSLFQPQHKANLRLRLDEYLRFGLEAGIFYMT
jgi:hypothetical protein